MTEREKQKLAREMARGAARDLWHAKVIYPNQYRDTERALLPCFLGALDQGFPRRRKHAPRPPGSESSAPSATREE